MFKFRIKLLVIIILVTSGLIIWQKDKLFLNHKLYNPVSKRDIGILLAESLNKADLLLQAPPVVIGDSLLATVSGIKVFFTSSGNFTTQVRALQLVLASRTIGVKIPSEIDLRFSKVIIRY